MIESSSRIKNTRLPCFIKYNQNAVLLDHRDGQNPSLVRCHPYQREKRMHTLVRCCMSIGSIEIKIQYLSAERFEFLRIICEQF